MIKQIRRDRGSISEEMNTVWGDSSMISEDMNMIRGDINTISGDINMIKQTGTELKKTRI